jgi:hypothetical protein
MKLTKTEETKGQRVPPLPQLTWVKVKESLYRAVDADGNNFEKILNTGKTIYIVSLNPERYMTIAQVGKSLYEAWEKAQKDAYRNFERKKLKTLEELITITAKYYGFNSEKVDIDIVIRKKKEAA